MSSLLIVAVAKFVWFLLARKEATMANLNCTTMKALDGLKRFIIETFASFGLVTVLRAAMVPPALLLMTPPPRPHL